MTSIQPYFQGYRRGLRDVYRAVQVHAAKLNDDRQIKDPIFVACDYIEMELRFLNKMRTRTPESISKKAFERKEPDIERGTFRYRRYRRAAQLSGYLNGYDLACDIVEEYGNRMAMPISRTSVMHIVIRLRDHKRDLDTTSLSCINILKRNKYVV